MSTGPGPFELRAEDRESPEMLAAIDGSENTGEFVPR